MLCKNKFYFLELCGILIFSIHGWSHTVVRAERRQDTKELMLLNCGAEGGSWKSHGQQGVQTSQSWGKSTLNIHWMLKLKLQYLHHLMSTENSLENPWCWKRLRAEEEGIRGWDGLTASPMQWPRTWANSGTILQIQISL